MAITRQADQETIITMPGRVGRRVRSLLTPLLFMTPASILVFLFFVLPVFIIIVISMTDMSTATGFRNWNYIGLENYRRIPQHPDTAKVLWNTIRYVGLTLVFFNVGMALLIALLTTHIPRRAGFFFRALWLLPRITPSVVYIMMWKYLAADAPYGVFNTMVLGPLGIESQNWVNAAPFLAIVVVNGFIGASFGMIIFTSAIESIPREYLMASKVDGASTLQTIRHVILPLLRWPLLFVTTYQTLSLLTSFEQILLLTDGGPGNKTTEVWALWAYHRALSNYYGNFQWGFGSALAAVLVLLGIVMAVVYMRFFQFDQLVQEPKIEAL